MINIKNKECCCGCEACYNACPLKCITMKSDEYGFKYPQIDAERCTNCGYCEASCPILNYKSSVDEITEGYAAINTNINERMKSSSGGIFSLLATQILDDGGVVVGCTMEQGSKCAKHVIAKTKNEIESLYGSKYLQSDINDIYIEVKKLLEKNREVMFSGTPCQIAGLKAYLKKPFKNLICVDLICHGVPSPLLWKTNVEYIEKKKHMKLTNVNFRCKKFGGHSAYGISYHKGDKLYYVPKECDPYFQFFLQDLSLRPSCYSCQFKGIDRNSDITLGDFWGIEKFVPDLSDGNGSSIVIIHSMCGKHLFERAQKSLTAVAVDTNEVFALHNKAMCESAQVPEKRQKFWDDYHALSYGELFKKYVTISSKERIKMVLRKFGILNIIRKFKKIGGVETSNNFGILYHFKK